MKFIMNIKIDHSTYSLVFFHGNKESEPYESCKWEDAILLALNVLRSCTKRQIYVQFSKMEIFVG
jgi:hypothetical protein